MTYEEAAQTINNNWPDARYTMLRDALTRAKQSLAEAARLQQLEALVEKLQDELRDRRVEEVDTGSRNGLQRCVVCSADADNCRGSVVLHESWCDELFAWNR